MNETVMRYELFAGVRNAPDHGTFVEYKDYAEAVAELATLRAQLAEVREALVVYHHAFVTDNKPPVAAQAVALECPRQARAALGGDA